MPNPDPTPNPPTPNPEFVPPNPTEITQPETQVDLDDIDPRPETPAPVAPHDTEPEVGDLTAGQFDEVAPENNSLEARDA